MRVAVELGVVVGVFVGDAVGVAVGVLVAVGTGSTVTLTLATLSFGLVSWYGLGM